MIKHSVIFNLKHISGSKEEQTFFDTAQELTSIPGVENFEALKQVSKKNNYHFGLSMNFANNELYEQYNNHPLHVHFIQQHWLPSVTDFMEIDYEPLQK
jgi:hypothetical protein